MAHVMLDLETWGVKPGAALRSIGAVCFDPRTGTLGDTFYVNIQDESCLRAGLTQDPATVAWWAGQSLAAREALEVDPQPIGTALTLFGQWWTSVEGVYVWGHGASFDPVLLEAAYAAALTEPPWRFWNIRCCRTVLALAPLDTPEPAGYVKHNALDDAKAQALRVSAVFAATKLAPEA